MPKSLTRLNQTIHTWLGLTLSLWILLMAVTGTTLYYKTNLIKWHHPFLNLDTPLATHTVGTILDSLPPTLANGYVYMPTVDAPWLEVVDSAKTHWYFTDQGVVLKRPLNSDYISVFVSLHHDLMFGEWGKNVLGILGLCSLILIVTGMIRWWPRHRISRRLFSIHWYSLRTRKGLQTLSELHKVSAVFLFIPIVLVLMTGTAIIYSSQVKSALVTFFPQQGEQPSLPDAAVSATKWQTKLAVADTLFKSATPRLIYLSNNRMRLKHEDEWHPNGRNYVTFSSQGNVTELQDVRQTAKGNQIAHSIYPLHVAAVGGMTFLIIATLAGLTLILLSITGVGYWIKRRRYKL